MLAALFSRHRVCKRLKLLMVYPEGRVPWYKAIRSPHLYEPFFPVLGTIFRQIKIKIIGLNSAAYNPFLLDRVAAGLVCLGTKVTSNFERC
jgi:hypothetical protein